MHATIRTTITALGTAALVAGGTLAGGIAPAAASTTAAAGVHVTDGWSAAILAPKGNANATGTLYLVSPTGRQVKVRSGLAATESVADIARDGRHVLLQHYSGGATAGQAYRVVDTRTGNVTAVKGTWFTLGFTHPSGQNLVGRTMTSKGLGSIVRTSLGGTPAVSFANTRGGDGLLPSLDGTRAVSLTSRQALQVNDNASGHVVRTLGTPKGYATCMPQHFSDGTHFTAACLPTHIGAPIQVFRFSTAGGSPVAVTARLSTRANSWLQYGYLDSWGTPAGQVVKVVSPCGAAHLGLVQGSAPRAFSTLKDGSSALGVVGNSVYYHDALQCDDTTSTLSRHDIATNRNTVLAGGARNPGLWVRSAALVDAKQ